MKPKCAAHEMPSPRHQGLTHRFARLLLSCAVLLLTFQHGAQAADLQVEEAVSEDGLTISYLVGGSGDTTLIFIHGWTCDRSYWDAQLEAFADDYRIIALDLAGHGDSALGRERYSMESFGADVAAVAGGQGPVVLIGHSMGGPVMLQAAQLLGDRVIGLVGVDTLRNATPPITSEDDMAARLAPLQADYVATAQQFLNSMFLESSDPDLRQAVIADMLATDETVGVEAVRGMMSMDTGAALEAVDVPLVLINSDYQPTNLPAVRQRHPDTTLYTMHEVGHFVMMEDPSRFNALLARALGEFHEAPGAPN
jgi:pimeloyl-ACP methyl ester carboxylesterase